MTEKTKSAAKKEESKREEAQEYAEAYADDQDVSTPEALARLAIIGWRRLRALKKDNARRDKGIKPQHRKVTVTVIDKPKHSAKKIKAKGKKKTKVKAAKKKAVSESHANGAAASA